MPIRGIFLKIYLCFCLATLLVVAAHLGLDWFTRSGPFGEGPFNEVHLRRTVAPVLTLYGDSAIEYRRQNDLAALARSTRRLKELSGVDAYLVGRDGNGPDGGKLPDNVSEIAARARRTGKTEIFSSRTRALIALPIQGADETGYCVVGDIPRRIFAPPPGPHAPGKPGRGVPPPLIFGPGIFLPPGPPFYLLRLLVTLIISAAVCYLLARYLTAPIVRLREATKRFSEGELSVRAGKGKVRWKDELSELAEDFDTMAERIDSLMTRQRQLIRDISHELRSPLARLNVAVELMKGQLGPSAIPTLERIEREAIVLNEMIGQVLELTRFENNAENLRMEPVDLPGLLEEIVDDANYEAKIRDRSVLLVRSVPCIISGSEQWLRRGIENVVRNAIRYTRDGTTVEVSLEHIVIESAGYAAITVRDHGEGVPESDLANLFLPFYRVSTARERQTGGSGLGLAITKSAVALHHGSVTASNAPEGGLVVAIQLPLQGDEQKQ